MADDLQQALFRVEGRVQGVGFRWWTKQQADLLGLRGHVRNRNDRSVEVRAVGTAEALNDFANLLSKGPPMAVVTNVSRSASPVELFDGFAITG